MEGVSHSQIKVSHVCLRVCRRSSDYRDRGRLGTSFQIKVSAPDKGVTGLFEGVAAKS